MAALTAAMLALSAFQTFKAVTSHPDAPPTPGPLPMSPDAALEQAKANKAAAEAAAAERRRVTLSDGRASTLRTGPGGLTDPAPTQRKTLLGL